jgi:hypothetical protein
VNQGSEKAKARKLKNEVDEQLANMIANNIRLHNKEDSQSKNG